MQRRFNQLEKESTVMLNVASEDYNSNGIQLISNQGDSFNHLVDTEDIALSKNPCLNNDPTKTCNIMPMCFDSPTRNEGQNLENFSDL